VIHVLGDRLLAACLGKSPRRPRTSLQRPRGAPRHKSVHEGFELGTHAEDVVRAGKDNPIRLENLLFDGLEFILLGAPSFPVARVPGQARKHAGASKGDGFSLGGEGDSR
jgi:hypothetical protein